MDEYYISILSIISLSKAGNGLILHSALAIEPQKGQSIGLFIVAKTLES